MIKYGRIKDYNDISKINLDIQQILRDSKKKF